MEFIEFSICNLNHLANAFVQNFKLFAYNKTIFQLKKICKENYSAASTSSCLYFSMNNLTASCHALFKGSLSYLRLAMALNILYSLAFTDADVLKNSDLSNHITFSLFLYNIIFVLKYIYTFCKYYKFVHIHK